MPEGGRAILLEEEVADPGESITAEQRGQQERRLAAQHGSRSQQQHPAAADEMQAPRDRVAVLAEIERIELAEAGEAGHARAPGPWSLPSCALPGCSAARLRGMARRPL